MPSTVYEYFREAALEDPALDFLCCPASNSRDYCPEGAEFTYGEALQRVDALIDQARREPNLNTRKQLYAEIQRVLAGELPYINLWYQDNVLVATKRVTNLTLNSSGSYDFLKTAELNKP